MWTRMCYSFIPLARISHEELLTYLLNFVIDFAGHPQDCPFENHRKKVTSQFYNRWASEFIEKLQKEQLCDLYA